MIVIRLFLVSFIISYSIIGNYYYAYAKGKQNATEPVNQLGAVPSPRFEGYAELVEKILPAVVNISATGVQEVMVSPFEQLFNFGMMPFNMPEGSGQVVKKRTNTLGSGFFISEDGYLITNHHVIKDSDSIVIITDDKEEYKAQVIGFDQATDVALLKVKGTKNQKFPFVNFGSSTSSRIGDIIIAIGNPFGLGGTVTTGIISAKARHLADAVYNDFLQTDAAINRGNSGGPMFNIKGEVIGINTAILGNSSGGNIGIGFAIPADVAAPIIEKLKTGKKISRGWLGVVIQPLTPTAANAVGLSNTQEGVLVFEVIENSPAEKAGIKSGDVLLAFNGERISKKVFLPTLVAAAGPGAKVSVEVWRHDKKLNIPVVIEELKDPTIVSKEVGGASKLKDSYGIIVRSINDTVKSKNKGSSSVKGVVVVDIVNESVKESGSLRIGDIIRQVNEQPISTVNDFTNCMKDIRSKKKKSALFYVTRNGTNIIEAVPLEPITP